MKKGVVLFITIFFITIISLLVLKNLDDTDKFLENQNYIINTTQVLIATKNTQKEVSKLLVKYKDEVDDILENDIFQTPLPINIENLEIKFTVKKSEKKNINDMKNEESKLIENLFYENDVFDYLLFEDIYKEKLQKSNQEIQTSKQVDDIINAFILESDNTGIEKIRDELGFIDTSTSYELNITTKYLGSEASSYYLLDDAGKVLYFDISFK